MGMEDLRSRYSDMQKRPPLPPHNTSISALNVGGGSPGQGSGVRGGRVKQGLRSFGHPKRVPNSREVEGGVARDGGVRDGGLRGEAVDARDTSGYIMRDSTDSTGDDPSGVPIEMLARSKQ